MQTLRWAFRPLPFMEECREKLGDTFSVKFLGFERPMVMISDPAAIKALYTEREHGLPPGRNIVLEPIVGSRSLLLLEGADHLAHRKLMLPAFHGERMRSYEPIVSEIVDAEIDSWPLGEEFPLHPRMQAITLEVILRVVFGVAEGPRLERLRGLLTKVLAETASPFTQLRGLAARRFGGRGPWAKFEGQLKAVDELLYAEIAEHRATGDLEERDDILSVLMLARFEDGEGMSDTDLRDQLMTLLLAGHETTATALAWTFDLLLRHPRGAAAACATRSRRARTTTCGRRSPSRCGCGRWCRSPAAASPRTLVADGLDAAGGHRRHPGDLARPHPRPTSTPSPSPSGPSASSRTAPDTYAWVPFGGGVRRCLGAAFAEFEMRIVLREVLTRCELHKASPTPERVARRNITLSPRDGTPVVAHRAPPGARARAAVAA